jgi:hypothetical protein
VGVDVKRIGSPRDNHKRLDEIVNKAVKFKKKYPAGKFGAVIYHPFEPSSHATIMARMLSTDVDGVAFPSGDSPASVESAVLLLYSPARAGCQRQFRATSPL